MTDDTTAVEEGRRTKRSGGRPTRDDAARRDQRVLDVAADLFLSRGFDLASLDTIADKAAISKATLYARFGDKRQLFVAVLRREIERWFAPLSADVQAVMAAGEPGEIETTLLEIGRQMTRRSLEPRAVAVGRVISMQAAVFPELAQLAHQEGWLRAVAMVARLLSLFEARREVVLPNPEIAADLLLNLILGRTMRSAAYGLPVNVEVVEERLQAAIKLFLHGAVLRY